MNVEALQMQVRNGIEHLNGGIRFRDCETLELSEYSEQDRIDMANGLFHGVALFALPVIAAEVRGMRIAGDAVGSRELAAEIDTLVRDVTTDAHALDVLTTAPVQAALSAMKIYADFLRDVNQPKG